MPLKLIYAGTSRNPETPKTDDGKFSLTSDGAQMLVTEWKDPDDFTAVARVRTFRQSATPQGMVWRHNPEQIRASVGKVLKDAKVVSFAVPQGYDLNGRTAYGWSTVVLPSENANALFARFKRQRGLDTIEVAETVSDEATEDLS